MLAMEEETMIPVLVSNFHFLWLKARHANIEASVWCKIAGYAFYIDASAISDCHN